MSIRRFLLSLLFGEGGGRDDPLLPQSTQDLEMTRVEVDSAPPSPRPQGPQLTREQQRYVFAYDVYCRAFQGCNRDCVHRRDLFSGMIKMKSKTHVGVAVWWVPCEHPISNMLMANYQSTLDRPPLGNVCTKHGELMVWTDAAVQEAVDSVVKICSDYGFDVHDDRPLNDLPMLREDVERALHGEGNHKGEDKGKGKEEEEEEDIVNGVVMHNSSMHDEGKKFG